VTSQRPLDGVILARHGETDDNLEPLRFQGFADTPLNNTGRSQAASLAERLAAAQPFGDSWRSVGSLWTSDLRRASETAEIVGARLGLQPKADPRLREGNRGRWEGHTFAEIERSEPDLYAAWRRAGGGWRFPGGESLHEQQERVHEALREIHEVGDLPAVVVCHGGCIRVMLCLSAPRGLDAFHEFEIPNVAVVPL
jgi:2,3-bisphosphoglycerate-dependent phosphoglycerate mutase